MNTVKMQLEARDIGMLRDELLRQTLVEVGMWDDGDERDPATDHAAAWLLVEKMTHEKGQGIVLSMGVVDALNGYGRLERWVATYQEYMETCRKCELHPGHAGNHSWRREWLPKFIGNGFSIESAISRLALHYAIEERQYGDR